MTAFLLALILWLLPAPVPAADTVGEHIERFTSDIALAADGSIVVTETIVIHAEGRQFTHGIFRDFPTLYANGWSSRRSVPFEVQHVQRNGHPEPYVLEKLPTGRRIVIGSATGMLDPGRHGYEIRYRTARQVEFGAQADELRWNATGHGWNLPIASASATLRLPPNAVPDDFQALAGPAGAADAAAIRQSRRDGTLQVATTRTLAAHEGLTIAVRLAKGVVAPPGPADIAIWWVHDNRTTVTAMAGSVALLALYVVAWLRSGRDPPAGPVAVRDAPPSGLSPAAVRYLRRMEFDDKTFTAAVVSMAAKGFLTIKVNGGTLMLRRTGLDGRTAGLDAGETAVAHRILPEARSGFPLRPESHEHVKSAMEELEQVLEREHSGIHFRLNHLWLRVGLVIIALTALLIVLLADFAFDAIDLIGYFAAGIAIVAYTASRVWRLLRRRRLPGSRRSGRLSHESAELLLLIPLCLAVPIALITVETLRWLIPAALLLLLQVGLVARFAVWLKAPTPEGQQLRDGIEGLRLFLCGAARSGSGPPALAPDRYGRLLPYAIALDVEDAWGQRLREDLAAASGGPEAQPYSPEWYSDDSEQSFPELGIAGLASTLGAAVAGEPAGSNVGNDAGSSGRTGGGGGGGGW